MKDIGFLCAVAVCSFALPFMEVIMKAIVSYIYSLVHGINKLMRAAANDDFKTVERCLRKGYDINAQSKDGYSALMLAAMSKETTVVMLKYLLANGANPNLEDRNGGTALIYAFLGEKKECMAALIEAGAVVNIKVLTLEALLKDADIKDIELSYHDPNVAVSLLQAYDPQSKIILSSESFEVFVVQIKDNSHDWLFLKYNDTLGIPVLTNYVIYENGCKNVVSLCYTDGKVSGCLCGRYKGDSFFGFVGSSPEAIFPVSGQEDNLRIKFLLDDACLIEDSKGKKINIGDFMEEIIKKRDMKRKKENGANSKGTGK